MAQEAPLAGGEFGGGEQHALIVFSLQQEQPDKPQSVLDEEREKHRRRAERFGTTYVDPGRVRKDFGLVMEARKERLRASHGFTTGDLDLFSPEEREKRAARAARFGLEAPLAPSLDAYKPDEELEARARRAVKFGVPYQAADAVLMDMDLYEQRREVGKDVLRRPEAIYLYGVDVMSTKDVLGYFSEYGPVFVEWLDDSSCNVLFDDPNSAKRAMLGKGTPLPPEVVATPAQEQQQQEVDNPASNAAPVRYQPELPVPENLADMANLPYVWHKGQDFMKEGTAVSLVYRMATEADVRDMNQPKRTRKLWKAAGGGAGGERAERGGRGRGQQQQEQQRRGKRSYRRGPDTDGDGPVDMDVDDGPGARTGDGEDDSQMAPKRPRGVRGGQRLAMKKVRPALQPYGGTGLLQVGGAVLPTNGHVLDYTELEDEGPVAAAAAAAAATAPRPHDGSSGGGDGGAVAGEGDRRRGRRGGGRGRARLEGDLREMLKARRPRQPAPAKGGPGQVEEGPDADDGHAEGCGGGCGDEDAGDEDGGGSGGGKIGGEDGEYGYGERGAKEIEVEG